MRRSVAVDLGGSVHVQSSVTGDLEVGLPTLRPATILPPRLEQARQTLAARTLTLYLIEPTPDSPSWYCDLEDNGELIPIGPALTYVEASWNALEVFAIRHGYMDPPEERD